MVPLAGILAIAAALIASTYGIKPHAITVDFPLYAQPDDPGPLTPIADRLILQEGGGMFWNSEPVTEQDLAAILEARKSQSPDAALLFTPEPDVSYARAIHILNIIRRHGAIDRCFRFSGIARYRHYENPDSFDDLAPHWREDCPPPLPEPTMPSYR